MPACIHTETRKRCYMKFTAVAIKLFDLVAPAENINISRHPNTLSTHVIPRPSSMSGVCPNGLCSSLSDTQVSCQRYHVWSLCGVFSS